MLYVTIGVSTFAIKTNQFFGLCDPKSKEFYFHTKHQISLWKYVTLTWCASVRL